MACFGGCLQGVEGFVHTRAKVWASTQVLDDDRQEEITIVDDRWNHADDSVHNRALDFVASSGGVHVRRMQGKEVDAAADLCVKSFNDLHASVGLDPEFPPRSVADVTGWAFAQGTDDKDGGFLAFVAEDAEDSIVGAVLIELRDGVGGIGPICSKVPGAGKLLMMAAMKAAALRGVRSVRLLQNLSNMRSFSLYLGLGFQPRRVHMQYQCVAPPPGTADKLPLPGIAVQPIGAADVDECTALHASVCGTQRRVDIASAVGGPHPTAVARDASGKLLGYTTGSYPGGHAVALSEAALQALVIVQCSAIAAAQATGAPIPPATLHVPHQCSRFASWLTENGFRLRMQLTLMSYGPHPEPRGGLYLPSIIY